MPTAALPKNFLSSSKSSTLGCRCMMLLIVSIGETSGEFDDVIERYEFRALGLGDRVLERRRRKEVRRWEKEEVRVERRWVGVFVRILGFAVWKWKWKWKWK